MPQSSLAMLKDDLDSEAGDEAGFGMGPAFAEPEWNAVQLARIAKYVSSGLRKVYMTEAADGVPPSYEWSWLYPVSTVYLAAGENTVTLPDDFSGLIGRVIPVSTGAVQFETPIVFIADVLAREAVSATQEGRPLMFAIEVLKGTTAKSGQRQRLRCYPLSDVAYSLRLTYRVQPDALTSFLPNVYGGAQHAELFKAAVRYTVELDFGSGDRWEKEFRKRLASSVAGDRLLKAQTVGPNRDHSDDTWPSERIRPFPGVLINGLTPT